MIRMLSIFGSILGVFGVNLGVVLKEKGITGLGDTR